MEQFMKLSVYVEKVKTAEKQQRPIGSNKPTGGFMKRGEQQRGVNQKLGALYNKMQNPKNRNFLDILEYNYLR